MKKILSLMLTLCLVLTMAAAVAESASAETVTVSLEDIGMTFSYSAAMTEGEADAENAQVFVVSDEHVTVSLYCLAAGDGTSLEDYAAGLTEQGYTVEANGLAEAGLTYDHLCVSQPDNDAYGAVVFMGSDGYIYDFECMINDETGAQEFGEIVGSLQPVQE